MVIGLGHTARVGKDTVGSILREEHGFYQMAFADALRGFVFATNSEVAGVVKAVGWEQAKTMHPFVRRTLVEVGNHARDILGEDVWINAAFKRAAGHEDVVITDVRYPNEAQAITQNPWGFLVKVTRPGYGPLDNVADLALASFNCWDAEIHNDGTVEDLRGRVAIMVDDLRLMT